MRRPARPPRRPSSPSSSSAPRARYSFLSSHVRIAARAAGSVRTRRAVRVAYADASGLGRNEGPADLALYRGTVRRDRRIECRDELTLELAAQVRQCQVERPLEL